MILTTNELKVCAAQMSALEVEHLTGDNRYACEHCGRKVDATRQLRLRTLPPYLCLSLKRFVFDLRVRVSASYRLSLLQPLRVYSKISRHVSLADAPSMKPLHADGT